jgi:hypothetical protein
MVIRVTQELEIRGVLLLENHMHEIISYTKFSGCASGKKGAGQTGPGADTV